MPQNDTIEFACPNCNTGLKVPANLAGVTGPCPHCQTSITAPHPIPAVPAQPPIAPIAGGQTATTHPTSPSPGHSPHPQQASQVTGTNLPTERPSGAMPHSQKINTPSQPTPSQISTPTSNAPHPDAARQTHSKPRKVWPSILFPTLFLILSATVVYLILDLMGIINSEEQSPELKESPPISKNDTPSPVTQKSPDKSNAIPAAPSIKSTEIPISIDAPNPVKLESPSPLKHAPQDVIKEGEIASDLPDLALENSEKSNDSLQARTALIKESQEVLKRFLAAQNFAERKPLITRSDLSQEELAATSLGKPLPKTYVPEIITIWEDDADRSFEVFFSVAFEQEDDDSPKIVLIRAVTYSQEDSPKIQIDSFLDLYEQPIQAFHDKQKEGTATFRSVVEYSAFCYDDIPKSSSMAKVTFFTNISATAKPIASAYLSKESQAFKKLSEMERIQRKIPVTVSVSWDTETDPKRPYLQIIRVEEDS